MSPTHIILYRTIQSLKVELVYEKKNGSLVFSGSRKIPTLWSYVQWETRQATFPSGTVDPGVGIFLSPLNTNDGFYLCHIPHTNLWESNILVMLKWGNHVMSHLSVFRNFLKPFFLNIKMSRDMWFPTMWHISLLLIEIRQLAGSGKNMPILRTGKQEQPAEQQCFNNRLW